MSEVIAHGSLADGNAIRSYRPRIAVPFGGGLDRSAATLAASREIHRDLINLLPREGKVRLRSGISQVLASLETEGGATMDRIVAGIAFEVLKTNFVIGYDESEQELHAFRVDSDGGNATHIGLWHTVTGGTPYVSLVEFQDRVFIAHDERSPARRADTYYWNPFTAEFRALEADWDDDDEGDQTMKFRGVAVHLDYLVGWGFDSDDEDRPDFVRTSLPGIAVYPQGHSKEGLAAFDQQHYAAVGNPGDPVTLCAPAGNALLVCKDSKTYPFVGFSPRNFGIAQPNEMRFGVEHARLGIHHAGDLYLWTDEGPRVTSGGPLEDLELPLDLAGPSPTDLADADDLEDGFCFYVPEDRVLVWAFGRRGYALSLRQPVRGLRWAYWEFAVPLEAGWAAFTAPDVNTASEGRPEWTSEEAGSDGVDVLVTHDPDYEGDEVLELWLKPDGGSWSLEASLPVSLDATQTISAEGLDSGTDYLGALRYQRGGLYHADYQDADPANWPAISQGDFTTGLAGDAAVTATWERTASDAEQIDLAFADFDPAATIEVERKLSTEADSEYTMLTGTPLSAGTLTYTDDPLPAGEVDYVYRVTETLPSTTRVHTVTRWAGPDHPEDMAVAKAVSAYEYTVTWTDPGDHASDTEIGDDWECATKYMLRDTVTGTDETHTQRVAGITTVEPTNPVELGFRVRLRNVFTSFTVEDYSKVVSRPAVVDAEDGADDDYNDCTTSTSDWDGNDPVSLAD